MVENCWHDVRSTVSLGEGLETHVGPSPEHPRPVLINLQQLDVDVRHEVGEGRADDQRAAISLYGEVSAEGMGQDHDRPGAADEGERDHQIAV